MDGGDDGGGGGDDIFDRGFAAITAAATEVFLERFGFERVSLINL